MEFRPILSALMRSKTGAILVALQVAISLGILANALHIVNQRQAVAARPSGMSDESALFYIRVRHLVKADHNEQVARQVAEAATLRAVGGVTGAAWVNQMPMSWSGNTTGVAADAKQVEPSAPASFYVSPDALVTTMGLHIVEGRDLNPSDVLEIDADHAGKRIFPNAVLVTRALAAKVWPASASAIGKTLYFGTGADARPARVVGVLAALQTQGAELAERGEFSVISPARITNAFGSLYVVRAQPGQRERVIREAETALRAAARTPVILTTRTVDQDRQQRYRADRAMAWMLVTVSVLLLLVTASGVVGMASLWVTQRRKQIGVRRALGARRVDILRYFVTENLMITSLGIAAGVLLAIGLNQLLVAYLGMARLPLPYLFAGAGVFWALGIGAVYGPAWRAATISPATATRSI